MPTTDTHFRHTMPGSKNKRGETPAKSDLSPQAVILAAGAGSRLAAGDHKAPPKALVQLGGLSLLERTARNCAKAGAAEIIIVVGCRGREIIEQLSEKLSDLPVRWVQNQKWENGNGKSVLAAKPFIGTEPFLVIMSDHIIFADTIRRLIETRPVKPTNVLAIDRKYNLLGDLPDAMKVRLNDNSITTLGKDLPEFEAVDIGVGLFQYSFFEELETAERHSDGKCAHSDGTRGLAKRGTLQPFDIGDDRWEDVDTPADRAAAEKVLFQSLRKKTDGFMSRHLERNISLTLTKRLANTSITPNTFTVALMLSLAVPAILFAQADPKLNLLGAFLFWVGSSLDGCDGELARLKFKESRLGGWLDLWSDNVVHIMIFSGIGIGIFRRTSDPVWLWLAGAACLGVLLSVLTVSWTTSRKKNARGPLFTSVGAGASAGDWSSRLSRLADALARRDFIFVLIFVTALGGLPYFLAAAAAGSNIYFLVVLAIALLSAKPSE